MMKIDLKITPTEDFTTLCSIYNIQPEMLIQSFIDQISFPCYYSKDEDDEKWALLFFLQYLDSDSYNEVINEKLQDYYLNIFSKVIAENLDSFPGDPLKAQEAGRKIIRKWHKAVLAERTKYITDQL